MNSHVSEHYDLREAVVHCGFITECSDLRRAYILCPASHTRSGFKFETSSSTTQPSALINESSSMREDICRVGYK